MSESMLVRLEVNGSVREAWAEPRRSLADFLRDDLGLTGTHIGCEQGVCGACTVLVDGRSARSCLLFAVQAAGCRVETVESLAPAGEPLHPLQAAFSECHGLQCGYCTPGFLLRAKEFLADNADPTRAEVREAIKGNLCRCTGYDAIVDSVCLAARRLADERAAGAAS